MGGYGVADIYLGEFSPQSLSLRSLSTLLLSFKLLFLAISGAISLRFFAVEGALWGASGLKGLGAARRVRLAIVARTLVC